MSDLLRRLWAWLTWDVPEGNCYRCRTVAYVREPVRFVFSDRLGYIPPRDGVIEVCPKCGRSGRIVRTESTVTWRRINQTYLEQAR